MVTMTRSHLSRLVGRQVIKKQVIIYFVTASIASTCVEEKEENHEQSFCILEFFLTLKTAEILFSSHCCQ
jgi:hypothetical protein